MEHFNTESCQVEELKDVTKIAQNIKVKQSSEYEGLVVEAYRLIEGTKDRSLRGTCEKRKHSPITFEYTRNKKTKSILDRLGEVTSKPVDRNRRRLSEFRKETKSLPHLSPSDEREEKGNFQLRKEKKLKRHIIRSSYQKKCNTIKSDNFKSHKNNLERFEYENVLSKFEVMSEIRIPSKEHEKNFSLLNNREVKSIVQVKPRVIPGDIPQPNKNLLLKAIAEAQKSMVQASKTNNQKVKFYDNIVTIIQ